MKHFQVGQKDWENFVCGKRKYLLTMDDDVHMGIMKCLVSNGVIAELYITDIVQFTSFSGNIYIVTAEVEQIWL